MSRKCMSLSENLSTVNCVWLSKVLKVLSIYSMFEGFARTKVSSTKRLLLQFTKHWFLILFQESIATNRLKPSLNHGTEASKDLLIFN